MPAQTGETVRFAFEFTVAGVPTSGLSPAPLITIFSPAGVALVTAAAMTEQAVAARYIYDYTLPGVAGLYLARAFSSQANLDSQYMECAVQVGQAWIQDLDAAISTRFATGSYTAPDNTTITAINAKTTNLPAAPASEGNVTAVGNLVTGLNNLSAAQVWAYVLEGGKTAAWFMRIFMAALAGLVSGAGSTTIHFRNMADDADRITATVDGAGDRTGITLDGD
jgi:hypothetical protein